MFIQYRLEGFSLSLCPFTRLGITWSLGETLPPVNTFCDMIKTSSQPWHWTFYLYLHGCLHIIHQDTRHRRSCRQSCSSHSHTCQRQPENTCVEFRLTDFKRMSVGWPAFQTGYTPWCLRKVHTKTHWLRLITFFTQPVASLNNSLVF